MKNLENIKLIIQEISTTNQEELDEFLHPCLTINKNDINYPKLAKYTKPVTFESISAQRHRLFNNLLDSIRRYSGPEVTTVYAYKKRLRNIWAHKGQQDLLDEFERRLETYNWKSGNMYHVILKVNHDNFDSLEAENQISRNFNRLINDISRGEKSVEILKYQAIKEWDETAHPHLHLFLLISDIRVSLRNLIKKYWTMGKPEIKRIKDEAHFKRCVTYCTRFWNRPSKKRRNDKQLQMRLPMIHKDSTHIRRAYYASKKRVDWDSAKNFYRFKKNHRKIMLEATRRMVEEHERMEKMPVRRRSKVSRNNRIESKISNKRTYNFSRRNNRYKKRKSYTYKERFAIDQTTIRIEDLNLKRPKWLTLETSMKAVTKLPGRYNDEKAYVIRIPTKDLPKLFELDKLDRIQEAMRSDLKTILYRKD